MDSFSTHPEKINLLILKYVIYFSMILCAITIFLAKPYLVQTIRNGTLPAYCFFIGPTIFLILLIASFFFRHQRVSMQAFGFSELLLLFFGLFLFSLLLRSARNQYDSRLLKTSSHEELLKQHTSDEADSTFHFDNSTGNSLIHLALLDKDHSVQQVAQLVIEKNLGIRFKNGAGGVQQATQLMFESHPSALLTRKGSS
ncbi:MAG: hypothetical protein KC505_04935 [Myxococcales bacterium]|nr:hypothetical protein [Myxococcales bacterium]USN51417.1 MAG: hypothetical protein H6731_03140 [Myxococcales bacterium]